ncbi:conserved hypothetical protein [Neospora caninum Liverpool]|uniref:Transcription initiation factor TFIID 23-30 kDa subunit n=1 Tax=Neospora caninum (strain Liverpool) TaxID=572307 RepID=F0VNR8_NEOCL|nr:conserved hypothetical protein [Neospora caninum Liverpool]CBZ55364.1 conserved hypothetical protein [Neospora caninum Liverpool]CEL70100.1 TPA: hypothetical protein BN1204_057870 [Neospora caninum Liverpool]|eukprot:XP_003885392.1 conserved hypothetical protein [Neospora caninum Liverpool]
MVDLNPGSLEAFPSTAADQTENSAGMSSSSSSTSCAASAVMPPKDQSGEESRGGEDRQVNSDASGNGGDLRAEGETREAHARAERERDESERPHKRWRGVLGSEELLTERDEHVLVSLEEKEPSILDEVCRYWLHAVGCATTDRTVARLVSVSVQLALEHIIDDAKLFYFCRRAVEGKAKQGGAQGKDRGSRGRGVAGFPTSLISGKTPRDYRELDLESFCAAFRKNGDSLVGPNLDLFLDASPAALPSSLSSSLSPVPGSSSPLSSTPQP